MHTEVERKFLVTNSLFMEQAVRIINIKQGYIGTPGKGEARVSIRDNKAWVMIKSNNKLLRLEYEIPIPKEDAIKARLEAEIKYFGKYKSQVLNESN